MATTAPTQKNQIKDELAQLLTVPAEEKISPQEEIRRDRVKTSSQQIAQLTNIISTVTTGTADDVALLGALRNLRIAKEKLIVAIRAIPDSAIAVGRETVDAEPESEAGF